MAKVIFLERAGKGAVELPAPDIKQGSDERQLGRSGIGRPEGYRETDLERSGCRKHGGLNRLGSLLGSDGRQSGQRRGQQRTRVDEPINLLHPATTTAHGPDRPRRRLTVRAEFALYHDLPSGSRQQLGELLLISVPSIDLLTGGVMEADIPEDRIIPGRRLEIRPIKPDLDAIGPNLLGPVCRRRRVGRLLAAARVILRLQMSKTEAGVAFVVLERPHGATRKRAGVGLGEEARDLLLTDRVALMPFLLDTSFLDMVVPVLRSSFAGVFVPNDDLGWVKQVVAVCVGSDSERNLFSDEVEIGIVRHVADEIADAEEEMCREEARADGAVQGLPVRDGAGPEEDDRLLGEPVEVHLHRFGLEDVRIAGSEGRGVRRENRPAAAAALRVMEKLGVPFGCETMVGVELQEVILALPEPHDLRTCPACAAALLPRDIEDVEARITVKREGRLLRAMLPADTEAQVMWVTCLGEAVLNRGQELWVSVGRDGNENSHPPLPSAGTPSRHATLIALILRSGRYMTRRRC